jgi:hypothetical protein
LPFPTLLQVFFISFNFVLTLLWVLLTEIRLHFSEFRCHGKLGIDYLQVFKLRQFFGILKT